jgi:CBS-domain-containing membrane protein
MGPPGTASTVITPTVGFNHEMSDDQQLLIINPAGALAVGAVALPGSPTDGQVVEISSTKTVTALTVTASTTILGAGVLGITASTTLSWRFIQSINTWVRRF